MLLLLLCIAIRHGYKVSLACKQLFVVKLYKKKFCLCVQVLQGKIILQDKIILLFSVHFLLTTFYVSVTVVTCYSFVRFNKQLSVVHYCVFVLHFR